jgi:putative membrane protein
VIDPARAHGPADPGGAPANLVASLILVGAAAAYAGAVCRLRNRGDRWPAARTAAVAAGLSALGAGLLIDDEDFRWHVVQHLLLAMLAPAGLALSAPVTLALRTLPVAARRRLVAILRGPVISILMSAPVVLVVDLGGLYGFYLTPLFAIADQRPWLHAVVHAHMLVAGCLLSWYLVGRDPMPHRAPTRTRLVVLLIAAAGHDILAKLMYARLLPEGAGPAEQVRAGAELMYYGGDVIEVLLAAALLAGWYARGGRRLAHARRRGS